MSEKTRLVRIDYCCNRYELPRDAYILLCHSFLVLSHPSSFYRILLMAFQPSYAQIAKWCVKQGKEYFNKPIGNDQLKEIFNSKCGICRIKHGCRCYTKKCDKHKQCCINKLTDDST